MCLFKTRYDGGNVMAFMVHLDTKTTADDRPSSASPPTPKLLNRESPSATECVSFSSCLIYERERERESLSLSLEHS